MATNDVVGLGNYTARWHVADGRTSEGALGMVSPEALVTGLPGYGNHTAEAAMRAKGKVHRAQVPDGPEVFVVTTSMEEACQLLASRAMSKDSGRLTSAITAQLAAAGCPRPLSGMFGPTMMNQDPPNHTRLRRLVASSLNATQVESRRPRVEQLTRQLLNELPSGVEIDLVHEFAYVLPVTVLCEVLGVPVEDRAQVHRWTTDLVLDDPARTLPASEQMTDYLATLINRVRTTPDDGLISALVHASINDDALDAEELMAMLFLLVVGGHETTTSLIANAMYALLTNRSQWNRLVADPTLARDAVEETLRWDAPTKNATHRIALQDIEIDGTVVPAGSIVLVSLSAAGRDPNSTDQAEVFDLHRPDRRHVGFGYGIHNCPGSQMARVQGEIALAELATRFPRTTLNDSEPPRLASSIVGGVAELRVTLS